MPTIDIPGKICPHCGGTKWCMKKAKNGNLHVSTCFYKMAERRKAWRATAKGKEFTNNYFKTPAGIKHREKYNKKESTKKLRAQLAINKYHRDKIKDIEKVKERKRVSNRKSIQKLTNSVVKKYIAREYTPIEYSDVPQDLIELKRKQLILTRQIKNNGKDQSSDNNHTNSNN
jgi:hypothetical protein